MTTNNSEAEITAVMRENSDPFKKAVQSAATRMQELDKDIEELTNQNIRMDNRIKEYLANPHADYDRCREENRTLSIFNNNYVNFFADPVWCNLYETLKNVTPEDADTAIWPALQQISPFFEKKCANQTGQPLPTGVYNSSADPLFGPGSGVTGLNAQIGQPSSSTDLSSVSSTTSSMRNEQPAVNQNLPITSSIDTGAIVTNTNNAIAARVARTVPSQPQLTNFPTVGVPTLSAETAAMLRLTSNATPNTAPKPTPVPLQIEGAPTSTLAPAPAPTPTPRPTPRPTPARLQLEGVTRIPSRTVENVASALGRTTKAAIVEQSNALVEDLNAIDNDDAQVEMEEVRETPLTKRKGREEEIQVNDEQRFLVTDPQSANLTGNQSIDVNGGESSMVTEDPFPGINGNNDLSKHRKRTQNTQYITVEQYNANNAKKTSDLIDAVFRINNIYTTTLNNLKSDTPNYLARAWKRLFNFFAPPKKGNANVDKIAYTCINTFNTFFLAARPVIQTVRAADLATGIYKDSLDEREAYTNTLTVSFVRCIATVSLIALQDFERIKTLPISADNRKLLRDSFTNLKGDSCIDEIYADNNYNKFVNAFTATIRNIQDWFGMNVSTDAILFANDRLVNEIAPLVMGLVNEQWHVGKSYHQDYFDDSEYDSLSSSSDSSSPSELTSSSSSSDDDYSSSDEDENSLSARSQRWVDNNSSSSRYNYPPWYTDPNQDAPPCQLQLPPQQY